MTLLTLRDLNVRFDARGGTLRAVDGVSLSVHRGETVGLVGESGCGKSTLGKAILGLVPVHSGSIRFDERELTGLSDRQLRPFRRRMQMIFQDPYGSLNPRQTVGDILSTPLKVHGVASRSERRERVARMIDAVGLPADAGSRYPHEFSGGQRQRIVIARALVLQPDLVICDEPVSALDLSIQAQILNLMVRLKDEFGLSYLFISHDLSVVRYFADRVLVMYLGRIVESAPTESLWRRRLHPYTQALIEAVPDPARRRSAAPLAGDLPSAQNIPSGCRFHTRCPFAQDRCRVDDPPLREIAPDHQAACHYAEAIAGAEAAGALSGEVAPGPR